MIFYKKYSSIALVVAPLFLLAVFFSPEKAFAGASCWPWGIELTDGSSIDYYDAAIVSYPASCTGGTFTCSNGALLGYTPGMAAEQSCQVAYPASAYIDANGSSELHLYPGDSWPTINWSSSGMDPATSMNGGSDFGGTGSPANDYCNVSGWGYIPSFGSSLNGSKGTGGIITSDMVGCWRNQYVYGYNIAGAQSNVAYATVYIDAAPVYGCTDSSATNYDSSATIDDGSCVYAPPPPTNPVSSCSAAGTLGTFSWVLPSGYTLSYFRVVDNTTGTYPAAWIPEQVPDTGPATSFTTTPGHSYTAWIHTRTASGTWSSEVYTTVVCPVPAAPTATLSVSPSSVAYNGRPTLTWSSTNATSCTAPSGNWSNSGTLSGNGLTDPLTSNTTFTFQCTGPGGTSALQ
ncbi:MAG: hypothetical protein WAV50_01110, partial [Minisyncoccia bacterium]